ncbi:hypothetical protein OG948_54375 (plasmid) [Embleya sp. NBC_00888]|uniref:hypothetical protein n=1 Tax=Embleya sp. NBC_00888 TaxID=2975960 RepID=UPI003869BD72|nr:hypothetical protein OG948_54375 [Embleya sp. NBC_00888]
MAPGGGFAVPAWSLEFGWGLAQVVFAWVFAFVGMSLAVKARWSRWTWYGVVRSVVTTATTLFLAWRYGFEPHGAREFLMLVANKYAAMALVAASLVPLLGVVIVSLARPGERWNRARRLVWSNEGIGPVATVPALVLAAAGVLLAWTQVVADLGGNSPLRVPVIMILVPPTVGFALTVPVFAVGSVFNAGNAHPILPPLAAPFMMIAAVVAGRVSDGVIATPEAVQDVVSIAAVGGVSALSLLEIQRLRGAGRGFRSSLV